MSFDKFLLAVESRDLSQADISIIRVAARLYSVHSSWHTYISLWVPQNNVKVDYNIHYPTKTKD
jgi:hypothetical protein